jgi:hypothetical protein
MAYKKKEDEANQKRVRVWDKRTKRGDCFDWE